jgi:hypothetical protein
MANILPVHQMIDRPDLVGNFARGLGLGNQQRALNEQRADEQTIRSLAPGAVAGDQSAIAQIAALDHERAGKLQGAGDAMLRRLEPAIAYMKNAQKTANPKAMQAAWEQVRPYFAQVSGHEPPPDFVTAQPHFDQLELKIQMAKAAKLGGTDTPTGYRELEMKLQAAGYKPGTPEYENAVRVALGTEGRASSAGMQSIKVENSAGGTDTYVFDPRKGVHVPFVAGAVDSLAPPQPTAPGPQSGQPFFDDVRAVIAPLGGILGSTTGGQHNAGSLHPDGNAVDIPMGASASPEAKANADQMIAALEAKGYRVRDERTRPAGQAVWSGPHLHAERVSGGGGGSAGGPVPGVGMTPGARAYATESGQQAAKIEYLPAVGAIEAQNAGLAESARTAAELSYAPQQAQAAGMKEEATQNAQARAELTQLLPKVQSEAQRTVALIDRALNHPGREAATGASSRFDPRNFLPGTDATNFRVMLEQLKGGTFLQAFQSLKGGGAITETEGRKAEQAIARLDQAQSDDEFIVALKDLRDVAEGLPRSIQQKLMATGQAQPVAGNIARPASEADYAALPSGALFVDPDDGKTYRKP